MIKNNIFLTGSPGVGKTTIIENVITSLSLNPEGFMVCREEKRGKWTKFFLLSANQYFKGEYYQGRSNKDYEEIFPDDRAVFVWRDYPGPEWNINKEAFNKFGVKLLNNVDIKDLVIMDELGRFELKADKFQKRVIEILKSPTPVFGVLKNEHNVFLDKIRVIPEVDIYQVTETNRDNIYKRVKDRIKILIK